MTNRSRGVAVGLVAALLLALVAMVLGARFAATDLPSGRTPVISFDGLLPGDTRWVSIPYVVAEDSVLRVRTPDNDAASPTGFTWLVTMCRADGACIEPAGDETFVAAGEYRLRTEVTLDAAAEPHRHSSEVRGDFVPSGVGPGGLRTLADTGFSTSDTLGLAMISIGVGFLLVLVAERLREGAGGESR